MQRARQGHAYWHGRSRAWLTIKNPESPTAMRIFDGF
jgi:hypothetical protein